MKRIAPLSLFWCLGLLFAASACLAQQYTVTDLGTLGGSVSYGLGINASGQVTGTSYTTGDSAQHAFLISSPYTPMTDLGTLGGSSSYVAGINASGQVTGYSYTTAVQSEH